MTQSIKPAHNNSKDYLLPLYRSEEERRLKYALLFSLLVHAAVLAQLSFTNIRYFGKAFPRVELTYYKIVPEKKAQEPKVAPDLKKKELDRKTEVRLQDKSHPPSFMQDISKMINEFELPRKQAGAIPEAPKQQININPLKSEEIKIPQYQSYYQILRRKLEDRLYTNIDFTKSDVGEIYLTFIITADGNLKQFKIIEGRTKASGYLQETTIKSLQEAAPFLPFSSDLNYPELPFNIVITYRMME